MRKDIANLKLRKGRYIIAHNFIAGGLNYVRYTVTGADEFNAGLHG